MITGVVGAMSSASRKASRALNWGSEWSARITSGRNALSSRTSPSLVSTLLQLQAMPARPSSRSISSASDRTSSTSRTRRASVNRSPGWLVQEQPVQAEIGDGADEGLEVHGLDDVAVRALPVRLRDVGLFAGGGQDDDGNGFGALVLLESAQDLKPVHLGQLQVEQDDLGDDPDVAEAVCVVAEEEIQRLGPVPADEDLVREIALPECAQRQLSVVGIVLDQQDFDLVGLAGLAHAAGTPGKEK